MTALNLPEHFYSHLSEEYAFRRTILLAALDAAGLAYRQPEGAYYVMADFATIDWDAAKYARPSWSMDRVFAEYIAREIGVAVVPGSSFYDQRGGETRVRFNFAKREDTLREAARRLRSLASRG